MCVTKTNMSVKPIREDDFVTNFYSSSKSYYTKLMTSLIHTYLFSANLN